MARPTDRGCGVNRDERRAAILEAMAGGQSLTPSRIAQGIEGLSTGDCWAELQLMWDDELVSWPGEDKYQLIVRFALVDEQTVMDVEA